MAKVVKNLLVKSEYETVEDAGSVLELDGFNLGIKVEEHFDFISEEYRNLYENSDATAFQDSIWLAKLYAILAPNRKAKTVIVTGRDVATHELIFVVPMVLRKVKGITLLESADLGVSDYASPVVRKSHVEALSDIAVSRCINDLIEPYDVLRIKPIREDYVPLWSNFFTADCGQLHFSSHQVLIDAPFDEWRMEHYSPSSRKEIDRKLRKFHREKEIDFSVLEPDEAASAIAEIQSFREGRFENDPLQQDFVLDFYQQIAEASGQVKRAHIHRLTADGETVGVLFGISKDGIHHGLLMGCNYENFSKYSPLMLMIDKLLRDWKESGGRVADFNIGDEPYKKKFGTKPVKLFQLNKFVGAKGWVAKKMMEHNI